MRIILDNGTHCCADEQKSCAGGQDNAALKFQLGKKLVWCKFCMALLFDSK